VDTERSHTADVVIVGAGLVGSALACALSSAPDLRIVVIDNQTPPPSPSADRFDHRVVALSPAAIKFLRELQVWQNIDERRYCAYQDMEVWDGEGNGRIAFSCNEVHRDELGVIVENSVVLQALHAAMTPRVTWLTPVSVTEWHQVNDLQKLVLSDGSTVTASLVTGADGAHSQLREMAGIPVNAWAYHHSAIVTTIRTQQHHRFTARQRFSHQGPLAFLPLHGGPNGEIGRYCSIVWSLDEEVAERMMNLGDQAFCRELTRVSEACLGEVEWADRRHLIPLWQRHARDYGRPGFALIGDAAHTIHPLAGQGVNLGLYDARALAGEITRAHSRGVPLQHPSVVQRYQRQRKLHNLTAMASMEGFKRLFGNPSPLFLVARNHGLNWVDRQLWLKRLLMQTAAGEI